MLDFLKELDTKLLFAINGAHYSFCDYLMFWASDRFIWIPFYFFLAFILYRQYGSKFWMIFLSVSILIILNNLLTVFIKEHVMRFRPCHNLLLQSKIILIDGNCGGLFSFVSSHAANSMALTTFIILLIGKKIKWLSILMLAWCLIVSYSRVYMGVHYPSDVLGGWLTGLTLALIVFNLYKRFLLKKHTE